jgi:hypothetical protein
MIGKVDSVHVIVDDGNVGKIVTPLSYRFYITKTGNYSTRHMKGATTPFYRLTTVFFRSGNLINIFSNHIIYTSIESKWVSLEIPLFRILRFCFVIEPRRTLLLELHYRGASCRSVEGSCSFDSSGQVAQMITSQIRTGEILVEMGWTVCSTNRIHDSTIRMVPSGMTTKGSYSVW